MNLRPARRRPLRHLAAVVAVAAIVSGSVFATGVAAQASPGATLDQSNITVSNSAFGAGTWGQTFLAGVGGRVSAIDLFAMAPGSVSVNVVTVDANGAPSGTVIGSGTGTTADYGWFTVPIVSTQSVIAGTQYAFVYTTTSANLAFNRGPNYDGTEYPNGASYNGTQRYDGYDFLFREYVTPLAPSISGTPTSDVPVGLAYSYAYAVGDGTSTSLGGGALPAGISLSSGGVLSGIPTQTGSFTFTVAASLYPWSTDITSTIVVREVRAPGQPTEVIATAGSGSANVTWIAPTDSGDVAITGYTVTASPGGATAVATSTSCTIVGLTPGTAYSFSVTATSTAGTGPASAASALVTPYSTPGAPNSFAVTSSDTVAALSWAAPAGDGFSAVTGYVIEQSTAGGPFVSVATPGPAETTATITGLGNGSSFSFRISAVNAAGIGTASEAIAATPFAFDPDAFAGSTPLVGRTLSAGDSIHLRATGLPSGATVTIELHSVVTRLATITIGSNGILDTTVTIPAGTSAGSHRLMMTVSGSGLDAVTSSLAFTVAAAATTPNAQLAFTGGTVSPAALLGGALALVLGAFLTVAARRSQRS